MDWIWDLFRRLPRDIQDSVSLPSGASYDDLALPPPKRTKFAASSSRAAPEDTIPPQLKQINDHVYEIHNPSGRRPSIELVFFHGLELKGTPTAHATSWLSRDGSELWLNWIVNVIPDARILSVSYDAHSRRTDEHGRTDMYVTTENLLQCLTGLGGEVGQDGCPVVLVGHCLGGLVMKQLCVRAHSELGVFPSEILNNFVGSIKGLFFYASPHHGTKLADVETQSIKGPLFEDVATLNTETQRRNEQFRKLRQKCKWKSYGIGESHEVTVGSFKGLVVAEASARYDVDGFYTESADHFNVCRPHSTTSSSFTVFMSFVAGVVKEDKARCGPKISFTDDIVGLQEQVIKVKRILKGARRVGIVGMGGLGKTTLAKTLYDNISGNFEYTCFLEEVKRNMDKKVNVDDLRGKIIERLFYKGRKVDYQFTWCTLERKKVLIILDDVVSEAQIMVMIDADEFLAESRLIVTSRDKGFLIQEDFELYTGALLNNEDSKQLFCINAFKTRIPASGYEDHVVRFTQKCEGLPLALKVAGKYLYRRSKDTWDAALQRLKSAKALDGNVADGLWSILRVSYDSLQEEEKEMFLDVATVYHGERVDEVKELWKGCNPTYDDCGWVNLLDKGLVTERGGWLDYKIIHMHDILRDLGRSIACPNPQNVSSHTRVTYYNLDHEGTTWPFHREKPKVKVLKISFPYSGGSISIGSIHEFDELRVVWLNYGSLYGACHLFPRNLMCVKIKGLHSWIDSIIQNSPPEELEQHQTLRYLEINDAYYLSALPDSLGQLQGLQHLIIRGCYSLKAIPDSLGELRALKSLRMEDCGEIVSLPDTLGQLQALEQLTIVRCYLLSLPNNTLGKLQALKHLVVRKCHSLGVLGDVLGKLQALEHLQIEHDNSLSFLLTLGRAQLQALKHLDLCATYFEDSLLETLGRIRGLEYLRVRQTSLYSDDPQQLLPDTLLELKDLTYLELSGLVGLEALPETLGRLQALEVLKIVRCELKVLPNTLGRLKSLKHLSLDSRGLLGDIPDTLGELRSLEYLQIRNLSLANVYISDLSSTNLPGTLGQLRALMHLQLDSCWNLYDLPDTIGQLQALRHLELKDCWNLRYLPDTIGRLQALKYLKVTQCGLKALPDTLAGLQALEELHLESCNHLEALPDTLGGLQALEELHLESCNHLEDLPDTLGLLHALKVLDIKDCGNVQALPVTVGHLQSLEALSISNCPRLRSLPDTLGKLESLESVLIQYCENLDDLPDSLKQILGRLKHVDLGRLKSVDILSSSRFQEIHRQTRSSPEVVQGSQLASMSSDDSLFL